MDSLVGQFLIAVPQLADPNFRQSVVLVVRHDDDGALGLIVNRPAPLPFHKVWEKISSEPCPIEAPLFVGGPCGGPLMALHSEPMQSEIGILPGIHFTADIQQIRSLLEHAADPVRLFGGYAGWGPGQLEGELAAGGWYAVDASEEQLFGPPDELWDELLHTVRGSSSLADWLGIKQVPPQPWMN